MKKYSKVIKAKKEYYNACKLERVATQQESTVRGVGDTAPDQVILNCVFMLHYTCIN